MQKFTLFKSCHCLCCRHLVQFKPGSRKALKADTHRLWRHRQKHQIWLYLVTDGNVDWEYGWLGGLYWA
jgi:hypothetical protein